MRKFIWILIFTVLAGCSVEKRIAKTHRLIEKYPETLDKYKTVDTLETIRDTTIYRDTTVEIFIPGDTIEKITSIPCPENVISDTLRASDQFYEAMSWVAEGKLHLRVNQPDVVLRATLDSVIRERNTVSELYYQELLKIPPKKITPKWVWFVLGIAVVEFVLLALTLLLRR
jgi:hypothetical protein